GGIARTSGKRRDSVTVQEICTVRRVVDVVAVALPKPRTIRTVLRDDCYVGMLAKVNLADKTFSREALVTSAGAGNSDAAAGEPDRGRFADHSVSAEPGDTEPDEVERLAESKESRIRLGTIGQPNLAVVGAKQSGGGARAIVRRVSQPFQAQLVIAN